MEQGNTTVEELRAALARDRRRAWVRLPLGGMKIIDRSSPYIL
jgi:hypothetical protein